MHRTVLHSIKTISKTASLVLLLMSMYIVNAKSAVAPNDAGQANAVCSTAGLSDKKYDDSSCNVDANCAASSTCVDASPLGSVSRISSPYGYRYHPIDGKWKGHKGVDYAAAEGTPIYAAVDGCISRTRYQYDASKGTGYGNYLDLQATSPAGVTVRYAHMSCFADTAISADGSKVCVKKGQIIGFVGSTGGSTGNHLHYEVQKNGSAFDPLDDSAKGTMCTVDEQIKEMDENAKAGGSGESEEGSYGDPSVKNNGSIGQTASPSGDGHVDKDCLPRIFREKYKTCMFCNLFRAVFVSASNIAQSAFSTLAPYIRNLMSIAFAVVIAFLIIKQVAAIDSKDAPTFVREIINKSFIFLVCYLLLTYDASYFMQLALEPMFNTGFKLAQMVMQGDVSSCSDTFDITSDLANGGLPASMGISILCTLQVIQDKLLDVITAGSAALCMAFFTKAYYIFPHPAYLFSGLGLWVCGVLLLFIFPFLMLDAVLQLSVACALLPAAIAAYAFDTTRGYVVKVWESFLSSMFHFVFLTIIMMILITIIDNAVGEALGDIQSFNDGGVFDVMLNDLSWTGVLFLKIVFVLLLGWAVLGEIAKFASRFASSVSSTNIGSTLGTLAYSGAKNATSRVIAPAAKAIGGAVKSGVAASAVGSAISDTVHSYKDNKQLVKANKFVAGDFKDKDDYKEETDDEGNTTYSYNEKDGKGNKKAVSMTINKDGNVIGEIKESTKTSGNKERQTINYGNIKVDTVRDSDGNEIKRDVKINNKDIQDIVLANGKINMDAVSSIRSTNGVSQELADEAIVMGVMQQRMPSEIKNINILENVASQKITRNQDGSITLSRVENDGTSHMFNMQVDRTNGQVITTYVKTEKPNSKGISTSKRLFSNGVFESVDEHKVDASGNIVTGSEKQTRFGLNKFYQNRKKDPAIDLKGNLSKGMPNEKVAFAGLSEEEIKKIKKEYKEHPRNNSIEEFATKNSNGLVGKLGSFLKNQGYAILFENEDNEFIGLSEEEIEAIKAKRREGYE